MAKSKKITVQQVDVVLYEENKQEYLSLTDIARYKDAGHRTILLKTGCETENH